MTNLSAGGCRVKCALPLVAGDQTTLTLYAGQDGPMTLKGRVVSRSANGVGIQFEKMNPSLQFQMGEVLASLR